MPSSLILWQETKKLLSQGLSIIPVRDKDDKTGKAKTPYKDWKKYQNQQITENELHHYLESFNTNAVAIICGKISGNLEVIDVDVKHEPGIDALLFDAIKEIYPNLWHILRIHKTPSGGYHILYKVIGKDVEGNKKLAERYSTEQELSISKAKKKAFIETRGEAGYVLAPPSFGYALFKNNEIPIISWEDRCSLINLCKTFTQIKEETKVRPPVYKSEESFYEEKPWQHFNRTADFLSLTEQFGWVYVKTRGNKLWLTKPGGKKNDVHAAIFLDNNLFYCFTTASDVESEKTYTPSQFITHIKFNNDWKLSNKWFVENGYGKINEKIETDLVKKGKELPPNASADAKEKKQQHESFQQQIHPYGVFWEFDDKEKLVISRERLYTIAEHLGFRLYRDNIYRIIGEFLHLQTERNFYDACKEYIKEEDGDLYEDICNTYESFLQKSGKFTCERLVELDESLLLKDTRSSAYKFFSNTYAHITASKITLHSYDDLNNLVLAERIQARDFFYKEGGAYVDFLKMSTGEITEHLKSVIGFLSHEYKDKTTAFIIVLTEECIDPKMGGGSGKNIFCDMLSYTTSYISKPGSQTKFDEKFFQSWNGQRVFGISDVPKDFDFSFLKEPAGGTLVWKKLFKNETIVQPEDAPKFIIQTNFSYEISDGGLRRRIIPIEFTNFFTKAGGVDVHYGKMFPDDFTQEDWNGYDTFIIESIKTWLGTKKLRSVPLSETGAHKQFIQEFGHTIYDIIQYYWETWLRIEFVANDVFKSHCENFYNENSINHSFRPSNIRINAAIAEYCKMHNVFFKKDVSRRVDLEVKKGKIFGADGMEPAPF